MTIRTGANALTSILLAAALAAVVAVPQVSAQPAQAVPLIRVIPGPEITKSEPYLAKEMLQQLTSGSTDARLAALRYARGYVDGILRGDPTKQQRYLCLRFLPDPELALLLVEHIGNHPDERHSHVAVSVLQAVTEADLCDWTNFKRPRKK
jgi:hypothetical protein